MNPEHPESDLETKIERKIQHLKEEDSRKVIVTDIKMEFSSMIFFMVKWVLASIPALFILLFIGAAMLGIIKGCYLSKM